MRILLVGILSLTLIGCSCPAGRHVVLDACTPKPCVYKTAAGPPTELRPTPFKPNPTTTKVGSKNATKTAKALSVAAKATRPTSPQTSNGSDKYKIDSLITMAQDSSAPPPQPVESAKSTVGTNVIDAVPRQASEASDPVLEKAKATVANKMEDQVVAGIPPRELDTTFHVKFSDPPSVEIEDMTRAIRRDPFGQSIDTMAMVTAMLIGMRLLYGAWPWETGKTWYRTKPIVPAPTPPEPNSEATETPADTENDHFDRKLIGIEYLFQPPDQNT